VSTIRQNGGGGGGGGQGSQTLSRDNGGGRDNSGGGNQERYGDGSHDQPRDARQYDRHGGYWWGGQYWWYNGYWSGSCYACGIWVGANTDDPSCPECQFYNETSQACVTVSDCPED
jgi:hypothetical protein